MHKKICTACKQPINNRLGAIIEEADGEKFYHSDRSCMRKLVKNDIEKIKKRKAPRIWRGRR